MTAVGFIETDVVEKFDILAALNVGLHEVLHKVQTLVIYVRLSQMLAYMKC